MKLWGFVKENKTFFLLLAIALLLRVFLIPFGTLETPDFTNFHSWGIHIAKTGPGEFYDTIWADYTPGYLYVLWVLGEIEAAFPLFKQKVFLLALYKLPAILADIAAGVLIFLAVSRFNKKFAIAASALYLFNPGVFGNSDPSHRVRRTLGRCHRQVPGRAKTDDGCVPRIGTSELR